MVEQGERCAPDKKKEMRRYELRRVRSATAPLTMVAAVAEKGIKKKKCA